MGPLRGCGSSAVHGADEVTGTGRLSPKPRAPAWAWLFVALCVAIPVLSLGGAIPGAIGGGGAFACHAVARDARKGAGVRVAICVAITVVCWVLFLALAGGVALLTGGAA